MDEVEDDTLKDRFLTFHLNGEDFGVEIANVTEIVGIQHITVVPDLPDFVKGVINLRGIVIPVIDVRARFRMKTAEYDQRTCVIVVQIKDMNVGLIVDHVKEVLNIPESDITPPPRIQKDKEHHQYVKGLGRVDKEVKVLLDLGKLLDDAEVGLLQGNA
jgi:purine-binding chemotaxis protein CheW